MGVRFSLGAPPLRKDLEIQGLFFRLGESGLTEAAICPTCPELAAERPGLLSSAERRYPDHTTKDNAVNKIVYVKAYFKPIGEEVSVKVPTGEIKKGFFGDKEIMKKETQWQQTGWSDSQIDGERLSKDVEDAVAQLNADGYEIQTVLPILSGAYDYALKYRYEIRHNRTELNPGDQSYVFGYGYSFTEGVTLVAKKIQSSAS